MILPFFLKKLLPFVVGGALIVAFGWAMFKWGQSSVEAEVIILQQKEIERVIEKVSEGREEFRRNNPTRDGNISLERLRQRQLQKRASE